MIFTISSVILSIFFTLYTTIKLGNKYLTSFIVLIVFAYVLVGPAISFFDLEDSNRKLYFFYQPIILVLFYIPFLFFILIFKESYSVESDYMIYKKLPILLPIILLIFLFIFIFVVVDNNLLFRRMGHQGLYEATNQLSFYQKVIYRLITESSFFIVLALRGIISSSSFKTINISLYKIVFYLFAIVFLMYFLLNSRMQFILFLVFLLFPLKPIKSQNFSNLVGYSSLVVFALLFLTIFREITLEATGRISEETLLSQVQSSITIIAKRLNILEIFYTIHHYGYNPMSYNTSGFFQAIYFPISALVDPQYYEITKLNLTTSSSVVVVNDITGGGFVDFPKTIIIEIMLSFGALSLIILALVYSKLISFLVELFYKTEYLDFKWYLSAYLITIFFQFEKEFFSMFISAIKWSLILIIFFIMRPSMTNLDRKGLNTRKL